MIHLGNRYHAVHCECAVDFSWDDDDEPRIHTVTNRVRVCPIHVDVPFAEAFAVLMAESALAMQVYSLLIEMPALTRKYIDANGEDAVRFRPGIDIVWQYSQPPNRRLEVTATGIDAAQRNVVSGLLTAQFGTKVSLH